MNKDKMLSPKQKKIAAMAGDPNKIEGEDFKKLKVMKASEGEMTLRDFVESGTEGFGPGSRASEQVLQEDVDKAAERFKTIKGAKKAIQRAKVRKTAKDLASVVGKAASPLAIGAETMKYFIGNAFKGDSDRMTSKDIEATGMVSGGSVMARGCKMGRNKKTKIY